MFHAKNPRRLQFAVGQQVYEINIHERRSAPRFCLLGHSPRELILAEDLIRTIVKWTARRYERSAFPDSFNNRLASARGPIRRIESAFKREGNLITGIFLRLNPPDEVGPDEPYEIIVRLTAKEEVFARDELEARALALTETVRREFDAIQGIRIIDYALVSEADFSLADVRETLRWDYDYLSFRAGTPDDTAPD